MLRGSILVVDDEEDIRVMLKDTLEEAGFSCFCASGMDEAVSVLFRHKIDLVLLDVMMPGRSGKHFFDYIVENNIDTGVVFITAGRDLDAAIEAMKKGALDFMIKPVALDKLETKVQSALEKRRSMKERDSYQEYLEKTAKEQSELLERKLREVSALNRMLQATVIAREELTELADKISNSAKETAEMLIGLSEQIKHLPQEFEFTRRYGESGASLSDNGDKPDESNVAD